ncbi:unnamed protein product [Euphydryas editha]|uniref:Uncharacterized protein n=1 Tax=Euphydryas editha TaxID=104508 RepID=A0AAU9V7R4_EUPED|nr:unnamed protein product [Euphydryas editha]
MYMKRQFIPNPLNTRNVNVVRHHTAIHDRVEQFLSSPIPLLQGDVLISLSELRKSVFQLPKRKAPGLGEVTNATFKYRQTVRASPAVSCCLSSGFTAVTPRYKMRRSLIVYSIPDSGLK